MSDGADLEKLRKEIDECGVEIKKLKAEKGAEAAETKAAVQKMADLRKKLPQKVEKAPKASATTTTTAAVTGEDSYYENRVKLVEELGSETGAYPHKWQTELKLPEFRQKFDARMTKAGEFLSGETTVSLAGRITVKRSSSSKLHFVQISGDGQILQLLFVQDKYKNSVEEFQHITHMLKRGDIIGAKGYPGRSNSNELSLQVVECKLLAPCLHMLPDDWFGLSNVEQRFRQRYLDLLVNRANTQTFISRARIISYIRHFFDQRDFVEVETPILNMIAGGAAARPFVTHHNDLNQTMYLRIAPELRLKECIVGGLDRVYEIGRQFRNEGIDLTHNPEFTSIEAYWAYQDYDDLMNMTEELLEGLAITLHGGVNVRYAPKGLDGQELPEIIFNFKRPFQRLRIIPELEKRTGVKFPDQFDTEECNKFLAALCKEKKVECLPPLTTMRLFDALIGHYLEPLCTNPTFLCDHPRIMSPLAKWHRNDSRLSERFEMFVNKKELVNAFTELNNPLVQRQAFEGQMADRDKGDDEAMNIDEGFCTALEYGLPPTAGWGLGVDRLCMFMTGQNNIKEVLLFPTMKPEHSKVGTFPPGTKLNGNGVPLLKSWLPQDQLVHVANPGTPTDKRKRGSQE